MFENEFFLNPNKKILISDSFSHAENIIKRFVLKNHKPIVNIEKITIVSLCESLYKQFGNPGFKVIKEVDGAYIVDYLIRSKRYSFVPETSYAITTAKIFYQAILEIKYGHIKNSSNPRYLELLPLIDDYEEYLVNNNLMDSADLINQCIGYLDKETLAFGDTAIIGVTGNLEGKLRYIEIEFIKKICQIYGENELNYIDFEIDLSNVNKVKVDAHGYLNEIKYVIDDIRKNGYNFGDVEIFTSDDSYNRAIKSLFEYYDISYYLANGEHLLYKPIFSIFFYALDFAYNNCEVNSIYNILLSTAVKDEFKALMPHLSNLKNNDYNIEQYQGDKKNPLSPEQKEFFNKLLAISDYQIDISELFDRLVNFVQYTSKEEDFNGFVTVLEEIKEHLYFVHEESCEYYNNKIKVISDMLSHITNEAKEDKNSIRITSLSSGYVIERKYNYFLGLSATQLTVKEIQSPVLSDEQLLDLLDNSAFIDISINHNKDLMRNINNLLDSAYGKCHLSYIYSSYDSVNFKNQAPSTLYIDLPIEEVKADYELDCGSLNKQEDSFNLSRKIEKFDFSPSALETYAACPLKFIYQYVEEYEKVDIQEYTSNWLAINEFGSFCHRVLERYFKINNTKDKQKTLNTAILNECLEKTKTEFMLLLPYGNNAAIDADVAKSRRLVIDYLNNYFNNNDGYVVAACEYNFKDDGVSEVIEIDDSNVIINYHGIIDRIDVKVDDEGTFYIRTTDYKTTKRSTLNKKMKEGKTFQNHIYKIAAKNYCLKHKDYLEKLLQKPLKFEKEDDITNISFDYVLIKEKPEHQVLNADAYEPVSEAKLKQIILSIINYNDSFNLDELFEDVNLGFEVESEYKKGSCGYCPYKRYCLLKIRQGEKMYPAEAKEDKEDSDGKDN